MKIALLVVLILTAHSLENLIGESNQVCNWQGDKSCPLYSFGNMPVCDYTNPVVVGPDTYQMKICTSEMFFMGGKYDVSLVINGVIQSVRVMNDKAAEPDNNNNCDSGQMSVGSRIFFAHCQASGPSKISGYWSITYKTGNSLNSQ